MRFESGDVRVDYEVHGDGMPIVFLHGLAGDRRLLAATCEPAFAADARYRRIYLDLPGHGESPAAPFYASADGLVEVVRQVVQEVVGDREMALVGYSYGGYLAPLLAQQFAAVRGMFLICPVTEPDFAKRRPSLRRVAMRDAGLRFSEDRREQLAFDEIAVVQSQSVLDAFQQWVHPGNIGALQTFVSAVRERYASVRPVTSLLQTFAGTTTIVAGRDDHWVGFEDVTPWVRAMARASLHVLPDCGHLLPIEQTARMRGLFSDWLAAL